MLVILLKRFGLGALIGVTIALFVLLVQMYVQLCVQLCDSWMKLWDSHLGVRLVEIVHTAYHPLQVKVLRANHGIQVEVLYAHHKWLILNGTLTFGELIMALGTLLLVAATWKRAHAAYTLAQYSAALERKHYERRVQGVTRLVLGELAVISTSVEQSLANGQWHWFYPLPVTHGSMMGRS